MVQISSTLFVAAAVVVPALSAPVIMDSNPLEAREPKGFGSAAKIFGKVASGVSLAATVGSLIPVRQHNNNVEKREPFTPTAQQMASAVKFAETIKKGLGPAGKIAHNLKSGVEFGASVAPLFPQKGKRDLVDLDAQRYAKLANIERREPFQMITGNQVASAVKVASAIKKGVEPAGKVAHTFSKLKLAGGFAGAAGFAGTVAMMNTRPQNPPPQPRDLQDSEFLEARGISSTRCAGGSPVTPAGLFGNTVAAIPRPRLRSREVVDLDAREPRFPGFLKKAVGLLIREDENGDVYVRGLDGLEQVEVRDPKLVGFLKKAAGSAELDALD